jgi:hypothetical protein
MANFKRKKSKRSIRCGMCTQYRWRGNDSERFRFRDVKMKSRAKEMLRND